MDLLTTLMIVALLVLLIGPARAQSKLGSHQLACLGNLRRLTLGWQMYADDNAGRLPRNEDATPSWVGGYMDYSPANRANTNSAALLDPRTSSMGPYTRDSSLYRCPADASAVPVAGVWLPRVRSYSMNSALGATFAIWLPAPPYRVYQRQSDLVSPPPAQHWVLIDEHPDSINDGGFAVAMPSSPSQARLIDFPAARHNGGGGLSFADGRAEIHRWLDARTMPVLRPGQILQLNVASPNNRDVLWLAERTSSKAP